MDVVAIMKPILAPLQASQMVESLANNPADLNDFAALWKKPLIPPVDCVDEGMLFCSDGE